MVGYGKNGRISKHSIPQWESKKKPERVRLGGDLVYFWGTLAALCGIKSVPYVASKMPLFAVVVGVAVYPEIRQLCVGDFSGSIVAASPLAKWFQAQGL